MAEDIIVTFCAQVGLRIKCLSTLVMTNFPQMGVRGQGHVTSYFWQISVNISKTVQDRDLQWKTNRK